MKDISVLVTGSGRRLGKAIASAFAWYGARLILHANKSVAEARLLAESFPGGLERHCVVTADLQDKNAAENIFSELKGKNIVPDILVNNAAIYSTAGFDGETIENYDLFMRVNFYAPLELMTHFAASSNRENRAIVNITDAAVDRLESGAYAASKRALRDATVSAAVSFGRKHGIRVNAVAPGPVLAVEGTVDPLSRSRRTSVLGRVASPEDIAEAVLWLAFNPALTGVVLPVDGGFELGKKFPEGE